MGIIGIVGKNQTKEVVEIHKLIFPDYMNTQLGDFYLENFFNWFITYEGSFIMMIRDSNDTIIGYSICADKNYGRLINKDLIFIVIFSIISSPKLWLKAQFLRVIFRRITEYLNFSKKTNHPRYDYSLVSLGIHPNYQNKGFGEKLLESTENEAMNMGGKTIRLSVHATNLAAIRFYEKSNWKKRNKVTRNDLISINLFKDLR